MITINTKYLEQTNPQKLRVYCLEHVGVGGLREIVIAKR